MQSSIEPMSFDTSAQGETQQQAPLIDDRVMKDWCDDLDAADVLQLLERVPEECGRCLAGITKAASDNDAPAVRRTAHRLKGMASNLGAARLAGIARQIELSSPSIDEIVIHLPTLQKTLDDTLEALAAYPLGTTG